MPPTETKFRLSRIVVSAVVFIWLCDPTTADGPRCYWCGPLADQVHRSQRAPSCSSPHPQVTVCDPGYPYCAVVATSPPYVESRYCVKLYQDECYSLYCNSTRTWRMSCPCRGDLCNGPNTERELDAFAGLAKLVARTHNTRLRRALIATAGFIGMSTNRQNRIDNTTVEENKNILNNLTDSNEEDNVKGNESQLNDPNTTVDTESTNISIHITSVAAPDIKSDENQMVETTKVADVEVKNNEPTTNSPNNNADDIVKTNDIKMNNVSIQIDIPTGNAESSDLKTEIILMSSETTKLTSEMKPKEVTETQTTPEIPTQAANEVKVATDMTTAVTKTTPADIKIKETKMKPSEATVEALQFNTPITVTTTNLKMISTPKPPQKGAAIRIKAHLLTIGISIMCHYKI